LAAKLGHEVSEAAVVVTELLGDLRHRTVFQEDGTEGFVAAVQRFGGLAEEDFVEGVVHGAASRNVIALCGGVSQIGIGRSGPSDKRRECNRGTKGLFCGVRQRSRGRPEPRSVICRRQRNDGRRKEKR
jgi:hypothetical protein